jgi:hypothetical protein
MAKRKSGRGICLTVAFCGFAPISETTSHTRGKKAMVMQPSTGFLNGRFMPDGTPTEDTEDCLDRITVA